MSIGKLVNQKAEEYGLDLKWETDLKVANMWAMTFLLGRHKFGVRFMIMDGHDESRVHGYLTHEIDRLIHDTLLKWVSKTLKREWEGAYMLSCGRSLISPVDEFDWRTMKCKNCTAEKMSKCSKAQRVDIIR